MIIGEEFLGLGKAVLRNIVYLRPYIREAHGLVELGTMAAPLGAFAARLATRLVAFDERTAKDGTEGRQLAK